ncbi:MAG: malonate transporter subunit MadM, partial [Dietzia cercidiphylli]
MDTVIEVLEANGLLVAFALVGVTILVSGWLSRKLTRGMLHGSAIA